MTIAGSSRDRHREERSDVAISFMEFQEEIATLPSVARNDMLGR